MLSPEALRQMPMPREGGKYPVPTVGDRALALYEELHAAARMSHALPPYCAPVAGGDPGLRLLAAGRVLVVEFDAQGRLHVRTAPLEENG